MQTDWDVYIICPVRNGTPSGVLRYVEKLEEDGLKVYFPPRDTNQKDETGYNICLSHYRAMQVVKEVHIFWDVNSKGSHFDLGMAFALKKKIKLIKSYTPDTPGKSYLKVIKLWGNSIKEVVKKRGGGRDDEKQK